MIQHGRVATLFGGTGFLGHAIVRELAEQGYIVRVPTREPDKALDLKISGAVGQIQIVGYNPRSETALVEAIRGADVVINLIGLLNETRKNRVQYAHVELPAKLARIAKAEGVRRFVHVSALGASASAPSLYGRTKAAGEGAVRAFFPEAIILMPSLLFGPRDRFFNQFALMARYMPFLPLIGGGHTKFQPLYVGDVALFTVLALARPDTAGRTFLLAGDEVFTLRQLFEKICAATGYKRFLWPVSWRIAKMKAFLLEKMPNPLLTRDQVEMMKADYVVTTLPKGAGTLASLGLKATPLDAILPTYLG